MNRCISYFSRASIIDHHRKKMFFIYFIHTSIFHPFYEHIYPKIISNRLKFIALTPFFVLLLLLYSALHLVVFVFKSSFSSFTKPSSVATKNARHSAATAESSGWTTHLLWGLSQKSYTNLSQVKSILVCYRTDKHVRRIRRLLLSVVLQHQSSCLSW